MTGLTNRGWRGDYYYYTDGIPMKTGEEKELRYVEETEEHEEEEDDVVVEEAIIIQEPTRDDSNGKEEEDMMTASENNEMEKLSPPSHHNRHHQTKEDEQTHNGPPPPDDDLDTVHTTPYLRSPIPDPSAIPVCVIAANPRHRSIFERNIPYMSGSGRFTYMTVNPSLCQYYGTCGPTPPKNRNPHCHPTQPTIMLNPYTRCCGIDRFRRVQNMMGMKQYDLGIVTGDEYCEIRGDAQGRTPHQLRNYYSDSLIKVDDSPQQQHLPSYLPLGPRFEFQYVTPEEFFATTTTTTTTTTTNRDIVLNFMGSLTSKIRVELVDVIDKMLQNGALSGNETVLHTSARWTTAIRPDSGYLPPATYRKILLRSTLTLCPSGHNPEAYRIFEAIEAGSIPVLALGHDYTSSSCNNAFQPLMTSPIPMLSTWTDLPNLVARIKRDPEYVSQLRTEITTWYRNWMHHHFVDMEKKLETTWLARLQRNEMEYDANTVDTFLKMKVEEEKAAAATSTSSSSSSSIKGVLHDDKDQTKLDDLSRFWGFEDVDALRDMVDEEQVGGSGAEDQSVDDPNWLWPRRQREHVERAIHKEMSRNESSHVICTHDRQHTPLIDVPHTVCVIADEIWQAGMFKSGVMSSCGVGLHYKVVNPTPCQMGRACDNSSSSLSLATNPRCPNSTWMPSIRMISWLDPSSRSHTKKQRDRYEYEINTAMQTFDVVLITGDEQCMLKPTSSSPSSSMGHDESTTYPVSHARHFFGATTTSEMLAVQTLHKPLWLPIGPRAEFGLVTLSDMIPMHKRQYLFSFVGSPSSEARRVLERVIVKSGAPFGSKGELGKLGYFSVLGTPVGDLKDSNDFLPPDEYRKIVLNSKFILCPRGHHFETNRLYEAAAAGAIPIMARGASYGDHPCQDALGPFRDAPIVWVKEWSSVELAPVFRKALQEPKWLERLSRNVTAWFNSLHRESALNLEKILMRRWESRVRKRLIGDYDFDR